MEYSVGLYGRKDRCFSLCNDACTCCSDTESRKLQSAPSDVLSVRWTGHGHSREARREALARVHARRGHCCQGDCGTRPLRVIALCERGCSTGRRVRFKPQGSSFGSTKSTMITRECIPLHRRGSSKVSKTTRDSTSRNRGHDEAPIEFNERVAAPTAHHDAADEYCDMHWSQQLHMASPYKIHNIHASGHGRMTRHIRSLPLVRRRTNGTMHTRNSYNWLSLVISASHHDA